MDNLQPVGTEIDAAQVIKEIVNSAILDGLDKLNNPVFHVACSMDGMQWALEQVRLREKFKAKVVDPVIRAINKAIPKTPNAPVNDDEVAAAIALVNDRFAYAIVESKDLIFDMKGEKFAVIDPHAFLRYMGNRYVKVREGDNTVEYPLGSYWMRHPDRREFDGFEFAEKSTDYTKYNLFRGFKYEDGPYPVGSNGQTPPKLLYFDHLWNNVAQQDVKLFWWMVAWMAFLMQRPAEKHMVALILKGLKGTGKSIVFIILSRLFNANTFSPSNSKHVVGNFNKHLMDVALLILEEAYWAGDKKHEGVFKQLISDPTLTIEIKGKDSFTSQSYLSVAGTTNEDHAVPASVGDERRYTVVEVSNAKMGNVQYFRDMMKEMENGGYEQLFRFLRNIDLSTLPDPTIPHKTNALVDQMLESLTLEGQWWYSSLRAGSFTYDEKGQPEDWQAGIVTNSKLRQSFFKWAGGAFGAKSAETRLGVRLSTMCPSAEPLHSGGRGRTMPDLATAREEFEKWVGKVIQW